MSKFSSCSKKIVKGYALSALSSLMFLGASAHGGIVPVGGTHTIDNSLPPEDWTLNAGSTLISNGAQALIIDAESAIFNATGGGAQRLNGRLNSTFNVTNASIDRIGGGFAIMLSDSTANLTNSTVTSDDIGLQLIRNNAGQIGSTATLTNNSSVTALNGGALLTGFSRLNVLNSSIEATDVTSYGVRLSHADLNATGSTIVGGLNGLQVGREIVDLARTSTVTLDGSTLEGKSGSAIVVGFQDRAGITANIDVLNGSRLIGANGTMLEVNDGAAVNFKADRSDLAGNIIVESGSTARVTLQNASTLNGNLQNVTQTRLDTRSTLNGDVQAVAGTGTTVSLDNGSVVNGNIDNVFSLSLNNGSSMTGDVLTDTNGSVLLDNGSVLTGQINNSANVNINNSAQWVMTGDGSVQRLALNNGVVRMGTNEQFQQLNVGELSGNGTFVMGTDLGNGNTDFLNVTGNASGQHQLRISATGTTPVTAEPVKVGNIASGDASFSLGSRDTVDAGTFVYRLTKEGQGLYLNPDKETVSTSSNTALALAGSARSLLNAEMNMLNDQIGDRGLSARPEASMRAASDSDTTKLRNSVWVRTYGNQYSVDNAYGDGYTQNQTGITGGADTLVDLGGRSWVLGGFVGSSHTKMDLKYGSSATVESVNAGVYGSTFDVESGVFVNVMAKINQFDNKAKVTMSDGTRAKGDYTALGASGSVAVGKHIRLKNNYFVEPQVRVSTGVTQSDSYRLDNGLEVKADTMRSLQGNVGVRGGRVISLENGSLLEPSLSAGVNHEFVKTNEVKINDDSFDDDRASSSIEYGAGVKWTPAQRNWQVSGQVGGSKGNTVSQDWSGSLRVSYFF
ncbi:putative autotransporter ROD_p1121 [Pseudomonas sp. Bi123]|uniref:autotransporter outer membrane beta-barrel domain-containing protein n=1 Tax=Pseudomonas TaxID=286 RepID=UPI001D25D15D|nr:autotransporter outer membrane beta-barrel domain-containing protein [Pseudomonas sp. Bi123]CAH0215062.1 putative autotransporter ROD_p1121 [Pseudomonas sp. Bi123]